MVSPRDNHSSVGCGCSILLLPHTYSILAVGCYSCTCHPIHAFDRSRVYSSNVEASSRYQHAGGCVCWRCIRVSLGDHSRPQSDGPRPRYGRLSISVLDFAYRSNACLRDAARGDIRAKEATMRKRGPNKSSDQTYFPQRRFRAGLVRNALIIFSTRGFGYQQVGPLNR